MSPFYSIFLERVIVNALSAARTRKKDKFINFASDLYHYGREFVINNREPDYKLSDIEKIEEEYQNLDIKETKQKIDYLPAEFEGQEPSKKNYYYKYGKYDENGKFIEKPTNREYFNSLVEKHEKEFSKFYTSSIIIKEVTENDENDENENNLEEKLKNILDTENETITNTDIYLLPKDTNILKTKYSAEQLKKYAKTLNIKYTGTKIEIADRIVNKLNTL